MSTGEWTNYNLFKSIETLTSGDHIERENSSFFPSSFFPPHPWEVQFIPQHMAFSLLRWTAFSLPQWMASSPDKKFPPMCSLDERPLPYLDEWPPLTANDFLSGSQCNTVSSINELWWTLSASPLPQWTVSSLPPTLTNGFILPSKNDLLSQWVTSSGMKMLLEVYDQEMRIRTSAGWFKLYICQLVGLGNIWFDISMTLTSCCKYCLCYLRL